MKLKGSKATDLLKKIAVDVRWCDSCSVPVTSLDTCGVCGSRTRKVKAVPPADIRPAFSRDLRDLRELLEASYGAKIAEKLLPQRSIVLLNKIDQIHKENIFYSIDFKNIKIPKNKKNIDIDLYLKKAKRENEKKNYIEAIDNYLQVIEFEQYSSENIKEKIFEAYLNLGNIYYNLRSTAEAYHCYGKCIYSNGVNNEIYEAAN